MADKVQFYQVVDADNDETRIAADGVVYAIDDTGVLIFKKQNGIWVCAFAPGAWQTVCLCDGVEDHGKPFLRFPSLPAVPLYAPPPKPFGDDVATVYTASPQAFTKQVRERADDFEPRQVSEDRSTLAYNFNKVGRLTDALTNAIETAPPDVLQTAARMFVTGRSVDTIAVYLVTSVVPLKSEPCP